MSCAKRTRSIALNRNFSNNLPLSLSLSLQLQHHNFELCFKKTMVASVQFRAQSGDLGMVAREVDEDLVIFLGMRNAEKKRDDHPHVEESDEFDHSKELKPDCLLTSSSSEAEAAPVVADDGFLKLESEMSDYNWLLTQMDDSLLPPEEANALDSAASQAENPNAEAVCVKSDQMESTCEESASLIGSNLLHPATSIRADASTSGIRRPVSGDPKQTPRAATPTGRTTLPAKSKPSRASTPTSRPALPSSKPAAARARSSTPTRGATPRSSAPASRPSGPATSKCRTRSATPTRKPTTPSTASSKSASNRPSGKTTGSMTIKNIPAPPRGSSPTVRSAKPSKPSEVLSSSHDGPQNSRASMPKRPVSASRERPRAPVTNSASSDGKPSKKSYSPAKVRAPASAAQKTGSNMLSRSRGYGNHEPDANPILIGTKMVNRVVNMRKLAPPKQDEYVSHDNNRRKSSYESLGFGRLLSKHSLDMAVRHMNIGRSISDESRPAATGVLPSACGNLFGSGKYSSVRASESTLTSSCDSSKSSCCPDSHLTKRDSDE